MFRITIITILLFLLATLIYFSEVILSTLIPIMERGVSALEESNTSDKEANEKALEAIEGLKE